MQVQICLGECPSNAHHKADPAHCSSISKYYTKLPKCKSAQPRGFWESTGSISCNLVQSAQPANAHHKTGDKENNNVTQTALPSLY